MEFLAASFIIRPQAMPFIFLDIVERRSFTLHCFDIKINKRISTNRLVFFQMQLTLPTRCRLEYFSHTLASDKLSYIPRRIFCIVIQNATTRASVFVTILRCSSRSNPSIGFSSFLFSSRRWGAVGIEYTYPWHVSSLLLESAWRSFPTRDWTLPFQYHVKHISSAGRRLVASRYCRRGAS